MGDSLLQTITKRMQALLFLNGLGLFIVGILFGWVWFFHLIEAITVWPLPLNIEVDIPGDSRGFRMGHMEAITQGLLLMALAFGGQFMRLSPKEFKVLFWTAIITTWMFTLPAMANALFETRGLAFGGGPFKASLANDVIFLFGWPPIVAVHFLFAIATIGIFRYLRHDAGSSA